MPTSLSKPKLIITACAMLSFLALYILQQEKKKKMSKFNILKNENVALDGNLKEEKVNLDGNLKEEPQEPGLKPINCEESEFKTDEESNEIFQEELKTNENKNRIEKCSMVETEQNGFDHNKVEYLNIKENLENPISEDTSIISTNTGSFNVNCNEEELVIVNKNEEDKECSSVDSQSGLSYTENSSSRENVLSDNDVKKNILVLNNGVVDKIEYNTSLGDNSRPDSGINSCENETSNTSSDCELVEQNKTDQVLNKEENLQIQENKNHDMLFTGCENNIINEEKEKNVCMQTSNDENLSCQKANLQNLKIISCCEQPIQNKPETHSEVQKNKLTENISDLQDENKVVLCEKVSPHTVDILDTNYTSSNKSESSFTIDDQSTESSQELKSHPAEILNKSVITEDLENIKLKSVKALSSRCSNQSSKKEWDDDASSSSNEVSNSNQRRKPRHKRVQSKVHNNKNEEEIVEVFVQFPSELVGALIGKRGRNINSLKQYSEALVYVHELEDIKDYQVIQIKGTSSSIEKCASRIKRNFKVESLPQFKETYKLKLQGSTVSKEKRVSNLELQPSVSLGFIYNQTVQQYMPVGGIVDVEVRDVTNINTIFVTPCKLLECGYLDVLNEVMASCYEHHHVQAPLVDRYAVNNGSFCVVKHNDLWCRAIVRNYITESNELDVMLVDEGGYYRVAFSSARQIRQDMINIPFHAQECMLQNVGHIDENCDANNERIDRMKKIFVNGTYTYFAKIHGYNQAMLPLIKLFQHGGNNANAKQINSELVKENIGKYVPTTYNYNHQ